MTEQENSVYKMLKYLSKDKYSVGTVSNHTFKIDHDYRTLTIDFDQKTIMWNATRYDARLRDYVTSEGVLDWSPTIGELQKHLSAKCQDWIRSLVVEQEEDRRQKLIDLRTKCWLKRELDAIELM